MQNHNETSTRYYSDKHEKSICKALSGAQTANSGATAFTKGDIVVKEASLLVEAKCSMTEKASISIKKDWIIKNKEEAFATRLSNSCICINFGPDTNNYYVIDEKLMRFLVDKLKEENE